MWVWSAPKKSEGPAAAAAVQLHDKKKCSDPRRGTKRQQKTHFLTAQSQVGIPRSCSARHSCKRLRAPTAPDAQLGVSMLAQRIQREFDVVRCRVHLFPPSPMVRRPANHPAGELEQNPPAIVCGGGRFAIHLCTSFSLLACFRERERSIGARLILLCKRTSRYKKPTAFITHLCFLVPTTLYTASPPLQAQWS